MKHQISSFSIRYAGALDRSRAKDTLLYNRQIVEMDRKIADVAKLLEGYGPAVLYASLRGEAIANVGVGGLNEDAVLPWLSAGKPIAAVAIAQLRERGLLD